MQLDSAVRPSAGGYLLGEPERRAPPLLLQGPPHKHLPLHRPLFLHIAHLHHHAGVQVMPRNDIQGDRSQW